MALKLHLLSEGVHKFSIDEFKRELDTVVNMDRTFHMGGNPVRVIKVTEIDETNGTLQVECKHWYDLDTD